MSAEKPLDGISRLEVVRSPVQRPNEDRLLRESRVKQHGVPTRLVVDQGALEAMLDRAKHSMSGRCVLHGCELIVRLYVNDLGHEYEQWSFEAAELKPEIPSNASMALVLPR